MISVPRLDGLHLGSINKHISFLDNQQILTHYYVYGYIYINIIIYMDMDIYIHTHLSLYDYGDGDDDDGDDDDNLYEAVIQWLKRGFIFAIVSRLSLGWPRNRRGLLGCTSLMRNMAGFNNRWYITFNMGLTDFTMLLKQSSIPLPSHSTILFPFNIMWLKQK